MNNYYLIILVALAIAGLVLTVIGVVEALLREEGAGKTLAAGLLMLFGGLGGLWWFTAGPGLEGLVVIGENVVAVWQYAVEKMRNLG